MTELTKSTNEVKPISTELLQLKYIKGESVYMTDTEGNRIEFKTTDEGARMVFTRDETGRSIAIEERTNGAKLYHISSDNTGLPSSHEIRSDQTEIVYFYNALGSLQHFVELRPNGDRVSTLILENGSIFSIEQKQIGGIVFQGWVHKDKDSKEGMVWLHPDGEISTHGDKAVVAELFTRFSRFLDGVRVVETR